jgi:hypothetical protein
MKCINQDDPGEPPEITKPFYVFTEDFQGSLDTPGSDRLDRHTGNVGKG